ncbi:MAG: DoxX family protein [Gammaproteobacteria bacterium]
MAKATGGLQTAGADVEDWGKLLLRVALGVLILLHGIAKVMGGPAFIMELLTRNGLPAQLGYLVYVGEVLAPLLVIIGLWTRPAALVIAVNMVVAIALVHMPELLTLSQTGGWALELQGMFLFGALAVAMLGAGRLSAGGIWGRWN